jgi:type IX secretion system PorP/SprF family membrane protein
MDNPSLILVKTKVQSEWSDDMMKRLIVLLLISLQISFVWAQYPVINHLDWMQGQVNPAFLGINKQENVLLDYNRAWISNEVNSNLGIIQYDRAFLTHKNQNIGGVGVSVLNNRVNYMEVFNRFQANIGAAYAFRINREVNLNFGLQGTFFNDYVNNTGLLTGSQYVPGWGFDPGSGSNEPMSDMKANYVGISTGLFLYRTSEGSLPDNYLGFSAKNINRPFNSFYEDGSRLSPQFNLMGGMRILEGISNKLVGELWYAHSNQKGNLTIGAVYQADNLINERSSEENISMRLLSRYSINHKFLVGGQLLFDQFVVGLTYDIPTPNTSERNYNSGFEVLLGFRRKVKTPKKRQKRQKTTYRPTSQVVPTVFVQEPKDSIMAADLTEKVVLEDSLDNVTEKSGDANVGELIDDKPLTGKVYFDFASREITDDSETFLREFISQFYLREKSVIVVTGHTDDVGTNQFNQKLSLQRAAAVRQKLISFGINEEQVVIKGKGEEEPLVPNNSEERRAKNRRVEITFY